MRDVMQVIEMGNKTKEFIDKVKIIHGGKYDYSSVDYTNARTKVTIVCPTHGEYLQSPDNHLRKRGCPKCAGKSFSFEEIINKANEVHKNKHMYLDLTTEKSTKGKQGLI